ncbi:class II glutamine amidotransferase [Actinocorallia aurantiaca]|jgi:glutamine amidotransferase|uniref:Ergothioneine biosynthesis protein EgtC n=1 Tax=Actinocorallia aurantiaca TaxID=46204 RepID=A0ABN3UEN9_9ACTN
MCRHFAWLGVDRSVKELVLDPPYGLPKQAARPRWQHIDLINQDGFGVGWFPAPGKAVNYRRVGPIEADHEFPMLAASVVADCVIGAARGASPGMPIEAEATAPFTNGSALMSLNGHLNVGLAASLLEPGFTPESTCDAAFLAALLWQRLHAGSQVTAAVPELVRDIAALDQNACLNILATDGLTLVATTWGETLCYRSDEQGTLLASEPFDDEDGWIRVPDRQLVIADPLGVTVMPLRVELPHQETGSEQPSSVPDPI